MQSKNENNMFKFKNMEMDEVTIEGLIGLIYDPDGDFYYRIIPEKKEKMGLAAYYKYLILGHAAGGDIDALQWIVKQKKCSLEVRDEKGNNLLMIAAQYGHCDIVEWLLDLDPEAAEETNILGKNASQIADENDYPSISELIQAVEKNLLKLA